MGRRLVRIRESGITILDVIVPCAFSESDIENMDALAESLRLRQRPLDAWLAQQLSQPARDALINAPGQLLPEEDLRRTLVADLNRIINAGLIYDGDRFFGIELDPAILDTINKCSPEEAPRLNRRLLIRAYPQALRDQAKPFALDTIPRITEPDMMLPIQEDGIRVGFLREKLTLEDLLQVYIPSMINALEIQDHTDIRVWYGKAALIRDNAAGVRIVGESLDAVVFTKVIPENLTTVVYLCAMQRTGASVTFYKDAFSLSPRVRLSSRSFTAMKMCLFPGLGILANLACYLDELFTSRVAKMVFGEYSGIEYDAPRLSGYEAHKPVMDMIEASHAAAMGVVYSKGIVRMA